MNIAAFLSAKRRRLAAITAMLSKHAADAAARRALWSAYVSTLTTTTSTTEADLALRIKSAVYPFHMRHSDIFVLEEVLLQRQYDLRTPLGPEPTIIDAGANIGITSLWLLASYPGASVHAFEPGPDNFRLLRANLGSIDRVHLNQVAVGAAASTVRLQLSTHGAMHSIKPDGSDHQSVEVECIRLDDYMNAHGIGRVDLLKVDVEGSELDLLMGLGDRLADVQVIVGEMHETMVDEAAFYRFLESNGFHRVRKEYYGTGQDEGVHQFEVARR